MARKKMLEEEKKSKLTVNINENLLSKVDELVEKNGDKRSRLIERLLNDYIQKNNI